VNVAVAGTAGGLRTPPARATVVVQEDLFSRRIVLLGRVIEIDGCTRRTPAAASETSTSPG